MRSLDVTVDGWLARLVAEVDELADRLAGTTVDDDDAEDARDRAAVATLRLDGSPIATVPPPPTALPVGTGTGPAAGGWLEVLRSGTRELATVPDEVVLAVEHHGARAGLASTDLAGGLRDALPTTLAELHGRMTDGLLHRSVAGRPRRSEQAVHDASLGRVLFFPVDTASLPARFEALATWTASTAAHPVVHSGVLHHQLLDLHPYEAANGRLARTAARLLLADAGVDERVVAQPEAALARDPIGYLDEVARSRRLGDPGAFVTRWAEALADGLLATLASLGAAATPEVPSATAAWLATAGPAPFTIVEHRDGVGGGAAADEALELARRAGLAARVHGTRGLRWVSTSAGDPTTN